MRIGFASSSWTSLWILLFHPALYVRKPDADIFRLALAIAQEPARQVDIGTLRCLSRSRKGWKCEAFFTRITGPRSRNDERIPEELYVNNGTSYRNALSFREKWLRRIFVIGIALKGIDG